MSTNPQLGNNLPKDEDYNGLIDIEKQLVDPLHGGDVRFAIVKFHTDKVTRKLATKDVYPTLTIDHFEPLTTQAGSDAAEKLLEEQWVTRTGKDSMPKAPAEESPTLDIPAETDADLGNDGV
jgi:hypothetical protein